MRLSGGGAVAEFRPTEEALRGALNAYKTFRIYLTPDDLVVAAGTLDSLLADVTEIRIETEAVKGGRSTDWTTSAS